MPQHTQNLPEVKFSFTVNQIVIATTSIVAIVSGATLLYYNIMTKLDDIDKKITVIDNQIKHESSLRKMVYMDTYFYKKNEDSARRLNYPYGDSILHYNPINDTLYYKKINF